MMPTRTSLKKNLMAACSIGVLAAVVTGCSSSDKDSVSPALQRQVSAAQGAQAAALAAQAAAETGEGCCTGGSDRRRGRKGCCTGGSDRLRAQRALQGNGCTGGRSWNDLRQRADGERDAALGCPDGRNGRSGSRNDASGSGCNDHLRSDANNSCGCGMTQRLPQLH